MADGEPVTPPVPTARKSDLPVRAASAAVMLLVAGAALWMGGPVFTGFAVLVGLGVLWEWSGLARQIAGSSAAKAIWLIAGLAYVAFAVWSLVDSRNEGLLVALELVAMVIGVDVGAYFAGRTFGGPKIAPKISPSKTWSGLVGGILGAAVMHAAFMPWTFKDYVPGRYGPLLGFSLIAGAMTAIVAQAGDFFESWMKRRAGVKDSGKLIPGHGGLFDRTDGLLAVLALMGLLKLLDTL